MGGRTCIIITACVTKQFDVRKCIRKTLAAGVKKPYVVLWKLGINTGDTYGRPQTGDKCRMRQLPDGKSRGVGLYLRGRSGGYRKQSRTKHAVRGTGKDRQFPRTVSVRTIIGVGRRIDGTFAREYFRNAEKPDGASSGGRTWEIIWRGGCWREGIIKICRACVHTYIYIYEHASIVDLIDRKWRRLT